MATSQWHQISSIVDWVLLIQPSSVLDVGAGFGKYGVLCREYLDVFQGRLRSTEWTARIDGIEFYEGCITPLHRFIYNDIHQGDALDVLGEIKTGTYQLALLIDVIEHLDTENGVRLLRECQRVASYSLISTPKRFVAQGPIFGTRARFIGLSGRRMFWLDTGACRCTRTR
jgi:hypothetical protein